MIANDPLQRPAIGWWGPAILALAVGCSADPPPAQGPVVYVDRTTGEVVVAEPTSQYPAIHPETGEATLMPAMHCQACGAWRRVPTPEQFGLTGGELVCPKCQQKLAIDGPLPTP